MTRVSNEEVSVSVRVNDRILISLPASQPASQPVSQSASLSSGLLLLLCLRSDFEPSFGLCSNDTALKGISLGLLNNA